jgi:hypothetical protein
LPAGGASADELAGMCGQIFAIGKRAKKDEKTRAVLIKALQQAKYFFCFHKKKCELPFLIFMSRIWTSGREGLTKRSREE